LRRSFVLTASDLRTDASPLRRRTRKHKHSIDGRTRWARRHKELKLAILADLGRTPSDHDHVTASNAAAMLVRLQQLQADCLSGKDVDTDGLIRLSNAAQRLIDSIGLKPGQSKPALPTLESLMARNPAESVRRARSALLGSETAGAEKAAQRPNMSEGGAAHES